MIIKLFGMLAEVVGNNEISVPHHDNTAVLSDFLEQKYPALKGMRFSIAVNNKVIHGQYPLSETDEIALLPPFSGG